MDSNESDKLGLLLDPEYQSHIIEVIKEWCGEKPSKKSSLRADLVDKEISKPLQAWIAERANGELPHLNGLEAAHELYIKTNDIVYILRYQTRPLYPEHVSLFGQPLTYSSGSGASPSRHQRRHHWSGNNVHYCRV